MKNKECNRTVTHATFSLERTFGCPPAQVFAAWSEPEAKAAWMMGSDGNHTMDFRVGGREVASGKHDGSLIVFETLYRDILEGQRIVYTSTMTAGDTLTTLSTTTVELSPDGDGTRLTLTEQGTYLDGHELPEWRERGTGEQLDALVRMLEDQA